MKPFTSTENMKLILASGSPRRKQLFRQAGFRFEQFIPDITETVPEGISPEDLVRSLSEKKGIYAASKIKQDAIIVSADTIVVLENEILGKPDTTKEAAEMLTKLSGNTHSVFTGCFTGLCKADGSVDRSFAFSEETKVTFSPLERDEIDRYVAGGSPMDKAGGYGIQDDRGALFIKKIDGDYYNVVGFPLNAFYMKMKFHFPELLPTLLNDVQTA